MAESSSCRQQTLCLRLFQRGTEEGDNEGGTGGAEGGGGSNGGDDSS